MLTPSARNAIDSSLPSLLIDAETHYKLHKDGFLLNFRVD